MPPIFGDEDEIEEIDDTVIEGDNDELDAGATGEEEEVVELDPKNTSIRDSLKNAFKKQAESENEPDPKATPVDKAKEDKKPVDKSAAPVTGAKATTEVKAAPAGLTPPPGWSKEARAKFSTLPPEVQASVAKREKEVSDGFAQYGEKVKSYEELDKVLAPRREAIKGFGASEAQIVNNLFQWMEGLTGQNKVEVFKQLGNNFGIDVSSLVGKTNAAPDNTNANAQQTEIPPQLQEFMQSIEQKFGTFEASQNAIIEREKQQRESAAAEIVTNWAKDKPHFNAVRPLMYTLLGSGTIPLKDGVLDLDAAYEAAVYATPSVRDQHLAEKQEAAEAKAAADKEKMEKVRLAKLAKAKKAGVSIKAAAPTAGTTIAPSNKKVNGQNVSIRDSIRAAFRESAN